jgi:hypothetical protein
MADLQRSMGCIWNIDHAGMQDIRRNSDSSASADSDLREKFSRPDSPENFIRADLNRLEPGVSRISKHPAEIGPSS